MCLSSIMASQRAGTFVPGSSSGDRIAILRGLNVRERVVTEGGTALEDAMKVREDANTAATGK